MLNKLRDKISTQMFNNTLYKDLNEQERKYIDSIVENTLEYEIIKKNLERI